MGKLVVHQDKVTDIKAMISICPFNALEEKTASWKSMQAVSCASSVLRRASLAQWNL